MKNVWKASKIQYRAVETLGETENAILITPKFIDSNAFLWRVIISLDERLVISSYF